MHLFTDWEGPWVLNDIAYELSLHVFGNKEFFERLSQYDDYLVYSQRRDDYQAGYTLKLLAPFLVASGITSKDIESFGVNNVVFVKDARLAMDLIKEKMEVAVISTSYSSFLKKTAEMLGLRNNLYGTEFYPEKYRIERSWKEWILRKVEEIAKLGQISLEDQDNKVIEYLEDFFWRKLKSTPFWEIMEDVEVVGSKRKREIVESYDGERIACIGDSISDADMLEYAREIGELALSFNGNRFALEHSNLAVISESALAEAVVVIEYKEKGWRGIRSICKEGHPLLSGINFEMYFEIDERVVERSIRMRKKLRGRAGELG